jgi:hypothetical protein
MKKQFYIATIVNTLLWGCESLTLRAEDQKSLEVFHHKAIRHVLNISRWKQKDDRITNENLRKRLDGIALVQETLEERRLDWLGNIARHDDTNLPKTLLTAWISKPRINHGQKISLRDSNAAAINRMLIYNKLDESPSNECPSKKWLPLAKDPSLWKQLIFKRRDDRLKIKREEDFLAHNASQEPRQADPDLSTDQTDAPLPRHESDPFLDPIPIPNTAPIPATRPADPISKHPPNYPNWLPPFPFPPPPPNPSSLPPLNVLPPVTCTRLASYIMYGITSQCTY